MTRPAESQRCTWMCLGILLLGLAGFAGSARVLLVAIDKVMSGRGLETYHTVWLVEFNYIGVLVLFGTVAAALLVAGALWLHEWWQWRSLERKYGGAGATPNSTPHSDARDASADASGGDARAGERGR